MKKRILVADDSVTIQKVIALTFAEEPFEIKSVGTGNEALDLMRDWTPDLVLADVIMPQMNGYELCRAVKALPAGSRIPVLLLAGTFETFDDDEARACGADGSVTKPFESGELINRVKTLLEGGGAAPGVAAPAAAAKPAAPASVPVPAAASPVSPVRRVSPPPPVPPSPQKPAEPDIWDILGEVSETPSAPRAAAIKGTESTTPPIAPLQGREVVDFGKMEMGIGKPPAIEKTKIESRERDFFGLEVEEGSQEMPSFEAEPAGDITFEVERAPQEAGHRYEPVAASAPPRAGDWELKMEAPPAPSPEGAFAPTASAQAAIEEFSPFLREAALEEPVAASVEP